MGKGDKKTRKGKIAIGSYGKKRPHDVKKTKPAEPAVAEEKK
jgi:30S ribosomal protein S31